MARIFISLFVIASLSLNIFAQKPSFSTTPNTYRTNANGLYWKYRKPYRDYWQQDVHYTIDVNFNDSTEIIDGIEHLKYWNNSDDTLHQVYFHLYQNAFTPNSYAHELRQSGKIKTVFGSYEQEGLGTSIKSLKVDGAVAKFSMDKTIMIVDLSKPLMPNGSIEFDIDFKTYFDKDDEGNMRRRMKSFRHDGVKHFDAVHWYPRICVYDRKFGWTTDQHLGKEFYGDFGTYDVRLTLPDHYVMEATGNLINKEEAMPDDLRKKLDISNFTKRSSNGISVITPVTGKTKSWIYHAENVHDFAWTTDPTYRIGEVVWNGISCIALAQEQNAHRWQKTAQFVADVVAVYSKDFGMYEYPKMVAADARDGMEYPMITLNSGNWPGHKYVISHEVGHNWFFGMIGNNETYRASLDEGFTQFLTSWSLKKINPQADPLRLDDNIVFNRYFQHVNSSNSATLNTHSDHFNSAERHGGGYSQVYFKTATMLYNLEQVLGEELFLNAMKHYVSKWKIGHPYWADFRQSIIEYTHVDLNWFFDGWIEKNYTIDYGIKSVKRNATGTTIELKRIGKLSMPLEIGVIDEHGAEKSYYIPNSYFVKKTDATVLEKWVTWDDLNTTYSFHVPFKAKEVIIDPRGRVADVNRLNNSSKLPMTMKFDKFRRTASSHRSYQAGWHPIVWYNHIDGLKVGLNSHGNYFNTKHVLDVDAYYNTGITFDPDFEDLSKKRILFNYQTTYTHQLTPDRFIKANSAIMDGALWNQLSYVFLGNGKNKTTFSVKTIGRPSSYVNDYALRPSEWNEGQYNTSFNMKWSHPYRYFKGNGRVDIDVRNAGLFSDYRYGWLKMETVNKNKLGKWKLNTRLFAAALTGDVAPESALKLDGGNSEDMLTSGLTRAPGFIQQNEASYGEGFNVIHQAGGLNVRGNAGYRATTDRQGSGFVINSGKAGAAFNAELEFTDVIGLNKFNRKSMLKFNPYLFSDAGFMALDVKNLDFNSGLRVDAGAGTTITLSSRKFNVVKPLRLRVDFPVFINRLPYNETDFFAFRYIVGIGKVIN